MARRIGVEVTSGIRSGPINDGTPSGIFHIAGLTKKGPADQAVEVASLADFENVYGGRTPYAGAAYDSARLFFEEGGSNLLVSRAVGPAAASASVTLADTATEPVDVAEVAAAHPGAWGNELTTTVTATENAGEYDISITDADGDTVAAFSRITSVSELVTRAESVDAIEVTSLGEDADPLDLAEGDFDLTGGDDDRSNVTNEEIVAALDAAGTAGEGGAVAVPGYPADVIGGDLADHAGRSRKIALLAPDQDATVGEAESLAAELVDTIDGQRAGLFFPHVRIPDGSATRNVSPEALIAGLRARTFGGGEFWQVPAGVERGRANWIVGTTTQLNSDSIDRLDEAQVNGIQTRNGRIYLNNWASLAVDRNTFPFLTAWDVLNNLKAQIQQELEPFVWETIDARGHLLSDINSTVTAILAPIASAGGFYARLDNEGEEIDPGYAVTVDLSNNSTSTAADNKVLVDVGVRLSPKAKLIQVEIVKVALGTAL